MIFEAGKVENQPCLAWALAALLGLATFGLALHAPGLLSAETSSTYIHTIAGGGSTAGVDGGDALAARLRRVEGLAVAGDGAVYLADSHDHRVWKVTREGKLQAVAGTGTAGFAGDGGPATKARLNVPEGLAVAPDGSLYVGDTVNRRVRKVDPGGTITTVAGTGEKGYTGDGGPATSAHLGDPNDLAVGPDGTLYVLDERGGEVRRVRPDGHIDTVPLEVDSTEDATAAPMINPFGLAVDGEGNLYVSDGSGHRVWRSGPPGVLGGGDTWAPFAGTGTAGFGGDGGVATDALLHRPEGLATGPDRSVYIADRDNHRVRKVTPDGVITTVVASGEAGFSGDGGDALAAQLDQPLRVAVGQRGEMFVNDLGNGRVRLVVGSPSWPTPTTTTSMPPEPTTTTSGPRSTTTTTSATTTPPTTEPQEPTTTTIPGERPKPTTTRPRGPDLPTTTRPSPSSTVPPAPAEPTTTAPDARGPGAGPPEAATTTTAARPSTTTSPTRMPQVAAPAPSASVSRPGRPSRPRTHQPAAGPSPGTTTPPASAPSEPSKSEHSELEPSEEAASSSDPPSTKALPSPKELSVRSPEREPRGVGNAGGESDSGARPSPPRLPLPALALGSLVLGAAVSALRLVIRHIR